MKIRKAAAFAASALIALNSVSIFAHSEEREDYTLISAPVSEIPDVKSIGSIGGGYYLCRDEEGTAFKIIYIGNDVISEWRKTGEFAWKDVECDLDLENFYCYCAKAGSEGNYFGIALKNYEYTRYYYCESSADHTKITTERINFGWACVRPDGYVLALTSDNLYFGKGTELNKIDMGYKPNIEFFLLTSGEYVGGMFYRTGVKTSANEDCHAAMCLVDKAGNVTEVYSTPEPAEDNYCGYVSMISIAYNNSALYWRENYMKDGIEKLQRIYCFESGELLTFPYNAKLRDGRVILHMELYDGVFNGRAIMKVNLSYSDTDIYALVDTETGEFVTDTYQSLSTLDGEHYLAYDENGWTLIDRDGNPFCGFDDVTEFYGGIAMACENGEGFLINGNMEKISDTVPAESSYMGNDENIFVASCNGEEYFVTYVKNSANTENPATGNTNTGIIPLVVCIAFSASAVVTAGTFKIIKKVDTKRQADEYV